MKRFLLLLLLMPLTAPAMAAPTAWHSLADSSSIDWTASWQGTPVKGQFERFTVTGHLDASHPADGTLKLVVETASISASSSDVTRALHGAQWFGVAEFPKALFTGTLEGEPRAMALQGSLRIKDQEKKLSLPITLTRQHDDLRLQGDFTLNRTDFGIGTGQWKSGSMIATEVHVHFSILLVPGEPG